MRATIQALIGLAASGSIANAALIDIVVRGVVVSNAITVAPYSGVTPGTPVQFRVRVDTQSIFSDEPENFTTWYWVNHSHSVLTVQGRPPGRGTNSTEVAFSGGDVYYQVDIPTVFWTFPQPTHLHCQFDGFGLNPFNNTGRIEQNLGTYSADVYNQTRYFLLSVAHGAGAGLTFKDMAMSAATFTFAPASVCPGDLLADGVVDDLDFVKFAAAYDLLDCFAAAMPIGCDADLTQDGFVEDSDFVVFAGAYDDFVCP